MAFQTQILEILFGEGVTPEDLLRDITNTSCTPQEVVRSACFEALDNEEISDIDAAYQAGCRELGVSP